MIKNMISESYITKLYDRFYSQGKLGEGFAIIFVYNDIDNTDSTHETECVSPIEHDMILNSFREIAQYTYSFPSEDDFIKNIHVLKRKHQHLLVYSMAQNIEGIGRRALIPLICKYYHLINIGSDEYGSCLSGNKRIMYDILKNDKNFQFPKSIFVEMNSSTSIETIIQCMPYGQYIIKPNNESASIGVIMIEYNKTSYIQTLEILKQYSVDYHSFCIQEYINGPEVEVTLLHINNNYYCPGICEIVFENNISYLDYDTVGSNAYSFDLYANNIDDIISKAVFIAEKLNFHAISRIDFRIVNNTPYVIDIGANPTISTHSSANFLFKRIFGKEAAIYHLLVMRALIEHDLFKPPLD